MRRPVLAIEQRIGQSRKGLVHAYDEGPGRLSLGGGRGRLGLLVVFVLRMSWRGKRDSCRFGQAVNFDVLRGEDFNKLQLPVQRSFIAGQNISGWAGMMRLFYRALTFPIVVIQKMRAVLGEIVQRAEQSGF